MATLFKRPEPKPGQTTYTIDLPGATDLFHFIIPALNDKELKMQRIKRMMEKKSPVPEFLQWIPPVINKIDDAQDILTTALWLAKPLIRRLPTRFIPFVGWALAVNDIANLSTLILGLAMTPGLIKPNIHKITKGTRYSKKYGALKVGKFLEPGGWRTKLGNYLQAAQAAETITGVGLTLGAVMGCLSDTMWAGYRLAAGDRVEIRLPPERDLLTKAYRFIGQAPQQWHARDILSGEDHAILLAAQNIAISEIVSSGAIVNDERTNIFMNDRFPVMIPWEESSISALQESGFDLSKKNYYKPYIPKDNPTYSDALDLSLSSISDYNLALRNEIGSEIEGSIFWMVGREAGLSALEWATGWNEDEILAYTPEQRGALKLAEYNFALIPPYSSSDLEQFLAIAMGLAENWGRVYPDIRHYIRAAEILGLKWKKKY